MKTLLAKLCIVAGCITFTAQAIDVSATTALPTTTSLAESLLAAQRNSISDDELFGTKVSYSTDVSQKQAEQAVGELWPILGAIVTVGGAIASCVKAKHTTRTETVCENANGDGEGVTCRVVTVVEVNYEWDCPG